MYSEPDLITDLVYYLVPVHTQQKSVKCCGSSSKNIVFLLFYLLTYFIVVQVQLSPFSPHHTPAPPILTSHPQTYPLRLCPWVLYTCSLMALPLFSPIIPLPPPLWLLSVCSLFQHLCFCFACLSVLLIRFHL